MLFAKNVFCGHFGDLHSGYELNKLQSTYKGVWNKIANDCAPFFDISAWDMQKSRFVDLCL